MIACAHKLDARPFPVCTSAGGRGLYGQSPGRGCELVCEHYEGPALTAEARADYVKLLVEGSPLVLPETSRRQSWFRRWLRAMFWPRLIRAGACSCKDGDADERTPVYRWLGLQTFGWPKLLRWRFDRDLFWIVYQPSPGCGCFVALKMLLPRIREWWRYTYGDPAHAA